MDHVRYMDKTREYYNSQDYDKTNRWAYNESAPFTPLKKPLSESRVTLISTAGFTLTPEGGPERGGKESAHHRGLQFGLLRS